MKTLPKKIIRINDGEEFVLNENGKYSNKHMLKYRKIGHLTGEWSYECLMIDHKGYFKVVDGSEDIAAMKKAWCDSFTKNDGHGDEDDVSC